MIIEILSDTHEAVSTAIDNVAHLRNPRRLASDFLSCAACLLGTATSMAYVSNLMNGTGKEAGCTITAGIISSVVSFWSVRGIVRGIENLVTRQADRAYDARIMELIKADPALYADVQRRVQAARPTEKRPDGALQPAPGRRH